MSETPVAPESAVKPRWNLTLAVILGKNRWDPTLIEILFLVIIAVVLYLLLSSEVEYYASGTRELPVRVFVFDVETGQSMRGVDVGIVRSPGLYAVEDSAEVARNFTELLDYFQNMPADQKAQTDEHGLVTFQHEFSSGSSHKHPNTRVFPAKCWVVVQGEGFRGIVISLGREAVEVGDVKRGGGFLVPIGIMRDKTPAP